MLKDDILGEIFNEGADAGYQKTKTEVELDARTDINEDDKLMLYLGAAKRAGAPGKSFEEELKKFINEYEENGMSFNGMKW